MRYTTLDNLKIKLWIDLLDVSQDDILTYRLNRTQAILDSIFWDSLLLGTKSYTIKSCDIPTVCWWWSVTLPVPNITAITFIDWNAYTGTIGTHYIIKNRLKNRVIIQDFLGTLSSNKFCDFEIVYEAWYDPVPFDLMLLQEMMIEWYLAQVAGRDVTSEKTWPHTVVFASREASDMYTSIISSYLPIII